MKKAIVKIALAGCALAICSPNSFGFDQFTPGTIDPITDTSENRTVITLSHSIDNTISLGGGPACAFGGSTADNTYYRTYTPEDFGIFDDLAIVGARFPFHFVDTTPNATIDARITLYTSNEEFPTVLLTPITMETLTLDSGDNGAFVKVLFSSQPVVHPSTELILSLHLPDNTPPMSYDARIGYNTLGETSPGYLSSISCSGGVPLPVSQIGFPDSHIILDLLATNTLNNDETMLESISITPNPAIDLINIKIPEGIHLESMQMYDVMGQKVNASISDGTLDVSGLSSGVYILNVQSSEGVWTEKIVKR